MEREERIQRMLTFSRTLIALSEVFHETGIEFKYVEQDNTASSNIFEQKEKLMMRLKEILERPEN